MVSVNPVSFHFFCSFASQFSKPKITLAMRFRRATGVKNPSPQEGGDVGRRDATPPPGSVPLSGVRSSKGPPPGVSALSKSGALELPHGGFNGNLGGSAVGADVGTEEVARSEARTTEVLHSRATEEGSQAPPEVQLTLPGPTSSAIVVEEVSTAEDEVMAVTSLAPAEGIPLSLPSDGSGGDTSLVLIQVGLPPLGWGGKQV